jgi:hypothetical protein
MSVVYGRGCITGTEKEANKGNSSTNQSLKDVLLCVCMCGGRNKSSVHCGSISANEANENPRPDEQMNTHVLVNLISCRTRLPKCQCAKSFAKGPPQSEDEVQ